MDKAWIKWNDTFNTGYKRIDEQHRKLVDIINDLHEIINKGDFENDSDNKNIFNKILERTVDYTTYHFAYEEKIMSAINYSVFADL